MLDITTAELAANAARHKEIPTMTTKKNQDVKITVNGQILNGIITGTSVVRSHRASERGLKLFVVANGVEYQCWCEGAQPYTAHKSAIQPRSAKGGEPANA